MFGPLTESSHTMGCPEAWAVGSIVLEPKRLSPQCTLCSAPPASNSPHCCTQSSSPKSLALSTVPLRTLRTTCRPFPEAPPHLCIWSAGAGSRLVVMGGRLCIAPVTQTQGDLIRAQSLLSSQTRDFTGPRVPGGPCVEPLHLTEKEIETPRGKRIYLKRPSKSGPELMLGPEIRAVRAGSYYERI